MVGAAEGEIIPEKDSSEKGIEKPAALAAEENAEIGNVEAKLIWGPWKVPGILGTINNAYACAYMIFVIFWSVWPPATPVKADTMNYSVVVTGGVMILSGIWYFVRARKVYRGPILEDEVAAIAKRAGSIVAV
jgi:hypothetical protein